MKIKCSAGKGVMEASECLLCARKDKNICGFDYSLLAALYDSSEDRSGEIHVSDLLSCPRKVFLQKTQPAAEMPHEMLARFKGLAVHDRLEESNKKLNPFPPMMSEMPVNVDDLVGRLDLIYLTTTKKWRLVDYKTAKEIYPSLVPYGEHEIQCNLYAWMLGKQYGHKPEEIFIQYISMAGPTQCKKCRGSVEWTPDGYQCPKCLKMFEKGHLGAMLVPVRVYEDKEIEEVVDYRKSLIKIALASGQMPLGQPGWLCGKYCQFLDGCEAGQTYTGKANEESGNGA